MRNILGSIALAFVVATTGTVAAQEQKQAPEQGVQSPSAQPGQSKSIAPADDQAVGPPEAEAGQREAGNPAGDPADNPDGGPRSIPGVTEETVPAKFSAEVAAQDKMAIMQRPVPLSGEQKRAIWQAVAHRSTTAASAQGKGVFAEPGTFLPAGVEPDALPKELVKQEPALRDLRYVKVDDKVLLIAPTDNIVRAVVEEKD